MAPQVFNDFVALVYAHPVITGAILVLFTPPFFPIVKYFSPLLISTALFMLALFTMGPGKQASEGEDGEDAAAIPDGDGEKVSKRMKPDGSWKDWVKSIEDSSLNWIASPRSTSKLLHKNDDWKNVNDENVSILQDASWVQNNPDYMAAADYGEDASGESSGFMAPSQLFKLDSDLQAAADRSIFDLGEDAPELEDVDDPTPDQSTPKPANAPKPTDAPKPADPMPVDQSASKPVDQHAPIAHQPMESLQIPKRDVAEVEGSPSTDLNDDESPAIEPSQRVLLTKNSLNAISGKSDKSDVDTPVAVKLSLSGKLNQIESLGNFMDVAQNAEEAGQESPKVAMLKPTTAEQVDHIKDQLESFATNNETENAPEHENDPVTQKLATGKGEAATDS
jgi:hypothetical protein